MIQLSAMPAPVLPILTDPQTEAGSEPTIPAEFAVLLTARTGSDAPKSVLGTMQSFAQPAAKPQTLTGKPGGKILPLPALPAAALAMEGAIEPAPGLKVAADSTGEAEQALLPDAVSLQALPLPAPLTALIPSLRLVAPPLPGAGEGQPAISQGMRPASPVSQFHQPDALQSTAALPQPSVQAQFPALTVTPGTTPTTVAKPTMLEVRLPFIAPAQPTTLQTAVSAAAPLQTAQTRPGRARAEESVNRPSSAPSVDPALASETPIDLAPSPAPTAQTMLAMAQDPSTPAPLTAVPTVANNRIEGPADFSTLVDRLVAAREAAQSSLAPRAVHAAIAHAEFGQVSLRFEQRDGALNVAMTSPDPDFARSVLAAAPAGQQGADNSDNRSAASRQDAGQSMSQPHAQTHGQANGQGAQRNQPHLPQAAVQQRQASTANSAATAEGQPARRRGIFA